MSATFRELFDEQDRDRIALALQARIGPMEARVRKLRNAERVTDAVAKLAEVEAELEEWQDLLQRVCEESN